MKTAQPMRSARAGWDNFAPDFGLHLGDLVENHAVEIEEYAQGVGIIRAPKMRILEPPPLEGREMERSDSLTRRPGMGAV